MKVNKSEIARKLGSDRCTVDIYLNGYKKVITRNKHSKIDDYYDDIAFLLSDKTNQIFFYKRVLWQYLVDNKGLSYSRYRVYRLSVSKSQDILFSFLNDAFDAFGGVPYEILMDNMKTVMDEATFR